MTTLAFLGAVDGHRGADPGAGGRRQEPAANPSPQPASSPGSRSGNWPAKIGGALIIIGVGALLRFAALQIHVPPISKLLGGVVIAMALGFGSAFVSGRWHATGGPLCLGGAAFGVAYLTAYSAFGLFEYVSSPAGLALLGLTSIGAGVYAVTRSALSLAVLSMIGAFLGPRSRWMTQARPSSTATTSARACSPWRWSRFAAGARSSI